MVLSRIRFAISLQLSSSRYAIAVAMICHTPFPQTCRNSSSQPFTKLLTHLILSSSHLCNSLSLGVLLGGVANDEVYGAASVSERALQIKQCEGTARSSFRSNAGADLFNNWYNLLGGSDCFNFSAFSESFKTSVYRCRWQRTLNLICDDFLLRFMRAAASPSVFTLWCPDCHTISFSETSFDSVNGA